MLCGYLSPTQYMPHVPSISSLLNSFIRWAEFLQQKTMSVQHRVSADHSFNITVCNDVTLLHRLLSCNWKSSVPFPYSHLYPPLFDDPNNVLRGEQIMKLLIRRMYFVHSLVTSSFVGLHFVVKHPQSVFFLV